MGVSLMSHTLTQAKPQPIRTARYRTCRLGLIYLGMDDADRELLMDWLLDPAVRHTEIAARMFGFGHDVNDKLVERHRHDICGCGGF